MLTSHDTYCRCRTCKPPLVGEAQRRRDALALCALIFLAALAAIMAVTS